MMRVEGETNVLSSRFGGGSVRNLGRDIGRFVVTTMSVPWELTCPLLGGDPEEVLFVESMEHEVVEGQVQRAPSCDTVVGIGGGQAIDLAKYFAWKRGCRLVTIPTVISVDAFVTPAAGIRYQHRVEYIGEASPDPLVIDYDLIRTAPYDLNISGVGDLLSIHTATYDWEVAERAGNSEFVYSERDVIKAREILRIIRQHTEDLKSFSDQGIRSLVESYMTVNTICLPAGHYRVEEGSEHFLFYELEERLQKTFIHGQIVGLGIYVMSRIQENQPEWITGLMDELGLRYQPADLGISKETLIDSLLSLKSFTEARGHWYSIVQEAPINMTLAKEAISGLRFSA
jgi:glycerol-1-phosphate dehydrogenase [NAD(P)+]